MRIELINTGSELLLGRVLNSHQQWICRHLADLGYEVGRQVCVADTPQEIEAAVRESLSRADVVITTGGLGPTSDDLTRERIARLLGLELVPDPETLRRIEELFARRHRPIPPGAKIQAMVPRGALVLTNDHGTAPGLVIEARTNPFRRDGHPYRLILLPGPPRELRPMFTESVIPLLSRELPPPEKYVCLILKTTGLGESLVEGKIAGPLKPLVEAGLDLGYCARIGEVDIRLAALGPAARSLVRDGEAVVRQILGGLIYGTGDVSLEETLVRLLAERGKSLALAESCTGGLLAHRLTNVPGASAVLKCGVVIYSNEAKRDFLGVSATALEEYGAVSEVVARQMAEGARQRCRADYALSITGIAGPSGGSDAKPVGTVFMALADAKGTAVERHFNPLDRETFKFVTSQQAMDLLRRSI